jgi:hypothetical protein
MPWYTLFYATLAKKIEFKGPKIVLIYTILRNTRKKKKFEFKGPNLRPNIHYSM